MKSIVNVFLAILLSWNIAYTQNNSGILSDRDKKEIFKKTVLLINENYVFPNVAYQIEKHLRDKQQEGFFDTISDPDKLVSIMTNELQSVCHDKHLRLAYESIEGNSDEKTENEQGLDKLLDQLNPDNYNSGIDKVEIFEGNIGYMRINHVMFSKDAKEAVTSALRFLSNTFAIIIDLRDNGGGQPEYMEYCFAYFFEKPTHINSFYRRDMDDMQEFWTVKSIPGKKMPDVPLFVLTSKYTFSGGEEFAYDLQALKRAKIIGDTTGGGAHPARNWHVYENIYIMIPFGRAVNPVTGTNWEGIGVIPDIPVKADHALDTALAQAMIAVERDYNKKKEKIINCYNEFLKKLDLAEKLYKNEPLDAVNIIQSGIKELTNKNILDEIAIDRIGINYLDKGNNQMAIGILKTNVQLFPESANVYDSLGEAYYKNSNWEMAKLNYEKSLELDPESISAKEALQELQLKIK